MPSELLVHPPLRQPFHPPSLLSGVSDAATAGGDSIGRPLAQERRFFLVADMDALDRRLGLGGEAGTLLGTGFSRPSPAFAGEAAQMLPAAKKSAPRASGGPPQEASVWVTVALDREELTKNEFSFFSKLKEMGETQDVVRGVSLRL